MQAMVNGALVPAAEAMVSVDDRGFRYGDGVFETIRVRDGMPYLWDYHLARLTGGLGALRIAADTENLLAQALRLLGANGTEDGLLRIQVSRGAGGRGYLPDGSAPTIVLQALDRPCPPASAALWLSSCEKTSPRALPTGFKLAQGLNAILSRMEAAENRCDEALLLDESGHISEASSANIFWRVGEALHTPALETGALAGVMRRRVLELSPWTVREGLYALADLAQADAVFLTNAGSGAVAVSALRPLGKHWESAGLAAEINRLIEADIDRSARALRESLASG